jgi:hypothetical protein
LPQAARIFLTVGICGGYTTFSTFSLDAWYLIEKGAPCRSSGSCHEQIEPGHHAARQMVCRDHHQAVAIFEAETKTTKSLKVIYGRQADVLSWMRLSREAMLP